MEFAKNMKQSFITQEMPVVIFVRKRVTTMQSEWISVNDRLPEKSGKYLVTGRQFRERTQKVWICEFLSFGLLRGWNNDAKNPIVEAWMPLPEPPKVGADNGNL